MSQPLKNSLSNAKTYWPYIVLGYSVLLAMGVVDNIRGPLFYGMTRDLHLTFGQASLFFAITSLVLCTISQQAHHLVGRLSSVTCLILGLVILSFGTGIIAFSHELNLLLLGAAVLGLGMGLVSYFQNYVVTVGSAPHNRRQLLSGLHTVYAFASLISPLLARFGFQMGWSWSRIFLLAGAFPLFVILISIITVRPLKETVAVDDSKKSKAKSGEWIPFLYIGVMIGLYICAELTLSTRIVLYVELFYNLPSKEASLYQFYFFLSLLSGRILFTFFPLKMRSNFQILKGSSFLSIMFFCLGLWIHPLIMAFTGFFLAPYFAVAVDYLSEIFKERALVALSYSLGYGSYIIVCIHLLIGWMTQLWGIQYALWLGPLSLGLSLLMLLSREKFFSYYLNYSKE